MEAFYGTTPYTQTLISCIIQYIYYFHRLDFQIFLPPALIMDGMEIVFLLICCPHVILIQDPKKASLDLVLRSHRRPLPNKNDHKTLLVTKVTQTEEIIRQNSIDSILHEKNRLCFGRIEKLRQSQKFSTLYSKFWGVLKYKIKSGPCSPVP